MENAVQNRAFRHSPCVGICALDPASGWCLGCGRTGDEIASWPTLDEAGHRQIWVDLPRRLALLSVRVRMLPWSVEQIGDFASTTLSSEQGTWVIGVPGAVAEFPCGPTHGVKASREGDFVFGLTKKAVLRLALHERLRAFAFGEATPIVLGVAKARVEFSVSESMTALGKDAGAVDAKHKSDELFDFGLGRQGNRFCVRTGNPELIEALWSQCGAPWQNALAALGGALLRHSPHRVLESALARIEVFAPIPAPGTVTPPGAHTHFLPEFLASGEDAPSGLELPDYALPVAIYYPPPSS